MLFISWVISGAMFGSVGVAMIASALSSGQRADDFQSSLLFLAVTPLMGAVLRGVLARRTGRSVTDKGRLNKLAFLPRLTALALVGGVMWKTGGPRGGQTPNVTRSKKL